MTVSKLVFIIDDDIDDIDILNELIHAIDEHAICLTHTNPLEALQAVNDLIPHYIFLDVNMPKITGDVLLKLFRSKAELRSTVITVMSTSMDKELLDKLIQDGANHAFEKPGKIDLLLSTLRQILN